MIESVELDLPVVLADVGSHRYFGRILPSASLNRASNVFREIFGDLKCSSAKMGMFFGEVGGGPIIQGFVLMFLECFDLGLESLDFSF